MTIPNARRDYAGSPKGKAGKPRISLPTQSLDDKEYVEDVPYRAEGFALPAFLTAHPKSADHLLISQTPFVGGDNEIYVRQVYAKLPGKALAGKTAGSTALMQFASGGATTTTTGRVAYGTDPDTGTGILYSSVEPIDAVTARKTTISAPSGVDDLVSRNRADPAAKGGNTKTTRSIVATGSTATAAFKTLDLRIDAIDAVNSILTETVLEDAAFPILTEYDREPETQALITITHQIVAATTEPGSVTPGTVEVIKPIDKYHSIRIVTVYSVPATYNEQIHVAYPMPTLLESVVFSSGCGLTVMAREGFTDLSEAYREVSFGTTQQTIAIVPLLKQTHRVSRYQVTDVIMDEASITFVGQCVGTVTMAASSPTKAQYLASWQGQFVLRSGESKKWHGGLYRTEKLYVKMR